MMWTIGNTCRFKVHRVGSMFLQSAQGWFSVPSEYTGLVQCSFKVHRVGSVFLQSAQGWFNVPSKYTGLVQCSFKVHRVGSMLLQSAEGQFSPPRDRWCDMSLALCPHVVSQVSQHFRYTISETFLVVALPVCIHTKLFKKQLLFLNNTSHNI